MKHPPEAGKPQREAGLNLLDQAIELHEAHMDGTKPTSEASQAKLMRLMERARAGLGVGKSR